MTVMTSYKQMIRASAVSHWLYKNKKLKARASQKAFDVGTVSKEHRMLCKANDAQRKEQRVNARAMTSRRTTITCGVKSMLPLTVSAIVFYSLCVIIIEQLVPEQMHENFSYELVGEYPPLPGARSRARQREHPQVRGNLTFPSETYLVQWRREILKF